MLKNGMKYSASELRTSTLQQSFLIVTETVLVDILFPNSECAEILSYTGGMVIRVRSHSETMCDANYRIFQKLTI